RAGAVAVLVRSLTTRRDDFPHTGLMQYKEGITRIPAACVSTIGADDLSRLLLSDPDLRVHIKLDCRHLSPVISHNVIGEIEGSENPEEIVLVGGHLDSWDLGTGAHDDGAGCVHALEALRLIKETGLRPGGGGVNIGPLGQSGTLLIGLIPDSQRYFDVHHSALDTIETVNSRELEMGAIAIALLAHILAQEGIN
ncbi:MAG: M28 family peptidase, partial [Acidobacteriota bacterium]